MEGSALVHSQHDLHFASSVSSSIFTALQLIASKASAASFASATNSSINMNSRQAAAFSSSFSSTSHPAAAASDEKSICDALDSTVQALLDKCERLPTFPLTRDLAGVKSVAASEEKSAHAKLESFRAKFLEYEETKEKVLAERKKVRDAAKVNSSRRTSPSATGGAAATTAAAESVGATSSTDRSATSAFPSRTNLGEDDDDGGDEDVAFHRNSNSRPSSPAPAAPQPKSAPSDAAVAAAASRSATGDNKTGQQQEEDKLEQSVAARALRYVASFTNFDSPTRQQQQQPTNTTTASTAGAVDSVSAALLQGESKMKRPPAQQQLNLPALPPKPLTALQRSSSNFECSFRVFLLAVTAARSYLSILAPLCYDCAELKTHWLRVVSRPSSFFGRWFVVDPVSAGRSFLNSRFVHVQHRALEHVAQLQKLEQELMEVIGKVHVALQRALYRVEEVAAQCSELDAPCFYRSTTKGAPEGNSSSAAAAAAAPAAAAVGQEEQQTAQFGGMASESEEKDNGDDGEDDEEEQEGEDDPLLSELHHAALTLLRHLAEALRRVRAQQQDEEDEQIPHRQRQEQQTASAVGANASPHREQQQQQLHLDFHLSESGTEPTSVKTPAAGVSQFAPPQTPISDAFGSTAAAPASAALFKQQQQQQQPLDATAVVRSPSQTVTDFRQTEPELFSTFTNAVEQRQESSPDLLRLPSTIQEKQAAAAAATTAGGNGDEGTRHTRAPPSQRNLLAENNVTDVTFLLHQLPRFCAAMDRHLHRVRSILSQRAAWSVRNRVLKTLFFSSLVSGCVGVYYLRKKQLTLRQVLSDYARPTAEAFVASVRSYILSPVIDLAKGLLVVENPTGGVDEKGERDIYAKMVRAYHEDNESRRVADANARTFMDIQGFPGFGAKPMDETSPAGDGGGGADAGVAAQSSAIDSAAVSAAGAGVDDDTSAASAIIAQRVTDAALDAIAENARQTASDEKVTTDFIEGVRRPLRSLIFGQLVRLLLIDVQRQKVDLAKIMSQSEDVMRKQDMTFRMFALLPVVVAFSGFYVVRSLTRASVEQPLRKELLASWRALHSVVSKSIYMTGGGGSSSSAAIGGGTGALPQLVSSSAVSTQPQQQQQHQTHSSVAAAVAPRSPFHGPAAAMPTFSSLQDTVGAASGGGGGGGGGGGENSTKAPSNSSPLTGNLLLSHSVGASGGGGGGHHFQQQQQNSDFHINMGSILLILYRMKMLGRALRRIRGESDPPSRSWAEATARVGMSMTGNSSNQHPQNQQHEEHEKKKRLHQKVVFSHCSTIDSDWLLAFESDLSDLEDHRATREQRLLVLQRMVSTYQFLAEKLDV